MAGDTLKDSRGRFVNVHRSRLRVTMSIKEAEMATLNYFKYSIYYIYTHTHSMQTYQSEKNSRYVALNYTYCCQLQFSGAAHWKQPAIAQQQGQGS